MLSHYDPMPTRVIFVSAGIAISFILVATAGAYRLMHRSAEGNVVEIHRPIDRAATLERIANSIVPKSSQGAWAPPCVELANVKRAVDARLAGLSASSVSRPPVLANRYVIAFSMYRSIDDTNCRSVAREVDAEVSRSWSMFARPDAWRENAVNKSELIWGGRSWRPNRRDIETRNAWAIMPGCIRGSDGAALGGVCNGSPARGLDTLIDDLTLVGAMAHRLDDASQTSAAHTTEFHGKHIPVGNDVGLNLDSELQNRAGALARCFTGETRSCTDVLPTHLATDWHFQPGNLRAGAAAVVILRVRTGEVVAASGSVSECTKANLLRKADVVSVGRQDRTPVFRPGTSELCAQLPDNVGAQTYLSLPPMLWTLGPGSTMKTFAILAGIESGVVAASRDDTFYRTLLARSRDPDGRQAIPQRIARQSAPQFRQLLNNIGFSGEGADVLFGGAGTSGWRVPIRSGFVDEKFSTDESRFAQIHGAKSAGRNADATFGRDAVADYLRAYRLGITAVGSGDIRNSAFGLSDWSRRMVLRSEGHDSMVPTHIASIRGLAASPVDLKFARPESVRRVIGMLNSATSSRIGGTASGSCRVAFGSCPQAGHPALLFAKTGTSEATDGGEAGSYFKVSGSGTPPAKLFMAAWIGADGEVYSGGAMTLRIREQPGSSRPELHSNSAAELLLMTVSQQIKKLD